MSYITPVKLLGMRSDGGEYIKLSKRLFASAVVGAMLILSAVLVVSLIGGDDKPDITNEMPPEDEQLPEENQDDTAVDEPSDNDAETASDDEPEGDDAEDEVPDEDDEGSDDSQGDGNGDRKGYCYEHKEVVAGSSQMNCENNFAEHVSVEDAEGDPMCECHGGDDDKGQSGN
ncbi:MAG: hypothetical protein AB7S97_01665 [Thermoplasmata archaeon]